MAQKSPANMTAHDQALYLQQKMGLQLLATPERQWLNTGSAKLNKAMGSEEFGLGYGKTYTLAGKPSSGKTLLATFLEGLAQANGAKAGVVDVEDSCDPRWMRTQGCDTGKIYKDKTCENIAIFRSKLAMSIRRSKKNKPKASPELRMMAAEELFDWAEKWMIMQRQYDANCKLFMMVDSTTAVEPAEQAEAGFADQNMRTKLLAPFLNMMTKRWNKVAANTNAIIIYICQLRTNPMQMFGNPEYIPGGAGVLFYPSSICKVKRVGGGNLYGPDGQPIGVASKIQNIKNKVGGGSVEGARCGFQAKFNEFEWTFSTVKRLESVMDKEKKKRGKDD